LPSGCTQKTDPRTSSGNASKSQGDEASNSHGFPALQFDYKMTSELLIAKSDPRTGDHWTARLKRDGAPSPENEDLWTIELGPDEIAYGDRKAHGGFVLHLLDTIRTLHVKEAPVSGTPESFGLASPLFILRWLVVQKPAEPVEKVYEIRLGGPAKGEDGKFEGLYASIGGVPGKTFIVQGAMLEMLDRITSFQSLRLPTVVTVDSDDIDQIEWRRSVTHKAADFYAQRDGDQWTDVKHRPVKSDVQAFLDLATHLRILRFIDDPKEQVRLEKEFKRPNTQSVKLISRKGQAQTLQIAVAPGGKAVYATFSTRMRKTSPKALAIFEVYPQILAGLRQL
jgi:hypothetical protein